MIERIRQRWWWFCLALLVAGVLLWRLGSVWTLLISAAAVGLWIAWRRSASNRASSDRAAESTVEQPDSQPTPKLQPPTRSKETSRRQQATSAAANDPDQLVEQMLKQGRVAVLLRPDVLEELDPKQIRQAISRFEDEMCLQPAGEVVVGEISDAIDTGKIDRTTVEASHARIVQVGPVFLDRFQVTNEEFRRFVLGNGYDEMEIWDAEIWPAVLDFVDLTGEPGPRYWTDQCYPAGADSLPVVGVSWYEAAAYARWCGKRLPSDAEWVKAASWPVSPRPDMWLQRKYPWGSEYEAERANLWSSGHGQPVAVDSYESGGTVGGLCQMIGNVWEWTSTNYGFAGDVSLTLPIPMKAIRGGAFDTFFESQATCNFQSGESLLNRKHNIGIRLALSTSDISPKAAEQMFHDQDEQLNSAVAEEVYG